MRFFSFTKQSYGGSTNLKRQRVPFNSFNFRTSTKGSKFKVGSVTEKPQWDAKDGCERDAVVCTHTCWGAKAFIKLHLWLYTVIKRRRIINAQSSNRLVVGCCAIGVQWLRFELLINKLLIGLLGIRCEETQPRRCQGVAWESARQTTN